MTFRLTAPSRRALWLFLLATLGLGAALFAACGSDSLPAVTPTPTRTPRPTDTPTPVPPTPTPTPAWPVTVFIPEGLPAPVAGALDTVLVERTDLFIPASSAETADVQVALGNDPGTRLFAEWIYAVAAPFPTVTDEVAWADVEGSWRGNPTGSFAGQPLLIAADDYPALAGLLGPAAEGAVFTLAADQLVAATWENLPSWAIVPFDRLEPRLKVLYLDGASVLRKDFDATSYPLVIRASVTGLERGIAKLEETLGPFPLTNRDPAKMTVLAMTGVTALGRCTATTMDREGALYPGQSIRDWLLEPDITHISNEVSFAENCQQSCRDSVVFCARPNYIELFEDLDIDVIELTGNHLLDWGVGAMELSLRMYDERSIPYYGGGWNLDQAQRPLIITHGVHTFGFVGCNPVGPDSDWATDERPGSAPCPGYDYTQMIAYIHELREQGIIPIVTLQYWEFDQWEPTPQQRFDFRDLSEAGAVIVSGSQAHHVQGFDFRDGAFIHYGLGNLFFDQMQIPEYRQEFVDRHVFYDGRHIGTEILTAMRDDYARPRPMTPEERAALLRTAFEASGW